MHFKSLELFGFKSFANRTKINFEKGITAIVGPNGCGKSNISDAVKWVLGEQSAKAMRGSLMEDVIFNGTESKEPLGYAEVSLSLSNESKFLPIEYDEVIISRRLYRSGESEYLINKNPVRLKDINELLMGSGVGTSAYSLIEQGKMDQILSANPEDRRLIFEEASGITKYKSKKREAIRRLEHTEQNLTRVDDIIKEVGRQINSIERQAKKAKRHQELFNRLKDLDTRMAAFKYDQMKNKKSSFNDENRGIKDREGGLLKSADELNARCASLKSKHGELASKIAGYRSDQRAADASLERNRDRTALNRERLQELYRHENDFKNEADSLQKRAAETEKAIGDITARLTAISENTKSKEDFLASKEEELRALKSEIDNKNEAIKAGKLKVMDVLALHSRLKNEAARLASDTQNVSARLRRLNAEKENVSRELVQADKSLSEARVSLNMSISKIGTLEEERITLQNDLKNKREVFSLLEKKIADSKNWILSLHSKLDLLRDLIKRNEGFTGGTQALLNSLTDGRLRLTGSCEPLAGLLEPKSGYEAACEAALNGKAQMLVVESMDTVSTALNFLKSHNLGKATFMNMAITGIGRKIELPDNQIVLGRMTDFMKFDSKYGPVFERVIGGTFLVKTLEDGISVMNEMPEGSGDYVRLVTLKGDILTKDTVTGGSPVKDFTTSIIGRKMRIKETEEHIAVSEKEVLSLKQELSAQRELIEQLGAKVKSSEDAIRAAEIELAQKRSAEANLERERKKLKEEADLADLELEESMLREKELTDKEAGLKVELERTQDEASALQDMIALSYTFIENGVKKKEELLISITQAQTELASLRKEEDDTFRIARSQKGYHDEQVRLLTARREAMEDSSRRQMELKEEIKTLESDTENLNQRKVVLERELAALESEEAQLKSRIDTEESELAKIKDELNAIKDNAHAIEMEEAQLDFQMKSLKERIEQIYKISIESITDTHGVEDPETGMKEVEDLSRAIEKMGVVNLVAIDEHKDLQERYDFLKHQREDLTNAKESLIKAIRKINQTTKELFVNTFTAIQAEFKTYFRFLFGGGKADIALIDENDILESGIEIFARPPGKKLQAISLLSGGEKALTATALLFAIFKVKPSPFCLLDEIDAPLDESNIGRFSKALQEFAKKSQFIIITHNKKTISIADVMYGITMEQSGVSKIISVKFARKKEEPIPV